MARERKVQIEVQGDHLERLARCSPASALAELIRNALDADAATVNVDFVANGLGGVDEIVVRDDGVGLGTEALDVDTIFRRLGGSWKAKAGRTRQNRMLHGKAGEGRFKAFALGDHVSWRTRRLEKGKVVAFTVTGIRKVPNFTVSEKEVSTEAPGTSVVISGLQDSLKLDAGALVDRLTPEFALYLEQYGNVKVFIDGRPVDPALLKERQSELDAVEVVAPGHEALRAAVSVIEWNNPRAPRALWLCDANGFSLLELSPGIQAPGFSFTAYVKSDYFRTLQEKGLLDTELDVGRRSLLEAAKKRLRGYFRQRAAEQAQAAVDRWRAEDIYPYLGAPANPVENVERQVFDICALNLAGHLPDFEKSDVRQKRLTFRLLKEAVEQNPGALQTILGEVLGLTKEKQDELAELLRETSLAALINASKLVTDRLRFLAGLEHLLFDPDMKKRLLERRQLHRVLAPNTWLFGEEYNLTIDDESLNTALERHLELLGRTLLDDGPVLREDGSEGVLDLMLSRALLQPHMDRREHLVVELKRPKQSVDSKVLQQIKDYAFAVVNDDRFRDAGTTWRFVAISNELSPNVAKEASQKGRPHGLVYEDNDVRMTIWVFTWSQIIEEARARLEFFRRALDYSATSDSASEHLKKVYSKYLPVEGELDVTESPGPPEVQELN